MIIPDNSLITQAMITYWMATYGKTNDESIKDLSDIEEGRLIPPEGLPVYFEPILSSSRGRLQADAKQGSWNGLRVAALGIGSAVLSALLTVGTLAVLGNVSIGGNASVGGNATIAGTSNVSGTTTASGEVVGVPKAKVITMATASTTPCAIQNTSGFTRVITSIGVVDRGSAASLGSITFQAGTGTTAFGSISYTKLLAAAITKISGVDIITTTSTPMTAYVPWKNGEWLVFKSSSTTHSGTCRIVFTNL